MLELKLVEREKVLMPVSECDATMDRGPRRTTKKWFSCVGRLRMEGRG